MGKRGRLYYGVIAFFIISSLVKGENKNSNFIKEFPFVARVIVKKLNVRVGPSTKYKIISTLNFGDEIVVYEIKNNNWYKIKWPSNRKLYVYQKFVKCISPTEYIIVGSHVNIRDKKIDSPLSRVICQLENGAKIKVIKKDGDWFIIEPPDNAFAWVCGKYTEYISSYKDYQINKQKLEEKIKKFEYARIIYDEETSRDIEVADYDKVISAYEDLLNYPLDKNEKEFVSYILKDLRQRKLLQQHIKQIRKENQELQYKIKTIEEKYNQMLEKIKEKKKEKNYLATGWIKTMGKILHRPATHKLIKGEKIIYLLKSKKYDLDNYVDKRVAINGKIIGKKWGIDIIEVNELKVLTKIRNPWLVPTTPRK